MNNLSTEHRLLKVLEVLQALKNAIDYSEIECKIDFVIGKEEKELINNLFYELEG